jgi:polyisoprenoid-binding protein YceI
MKPTLSSLAALLVLTCLAPSPSQAEDENAVPAASTDPVPAGAYKLDKAHSSLVFRANHLGFSRYTGRFERFDVQLQFDPAHPETSSVKVTIDPTSINSDNAPDGFMDQLRSAQWLDVAKFPQLTFTSTKVTRNGPKGLRIEGELGLHGVKRPVTLEATYNGGYAGHPMDPNARIGFSAHGTLKRSQFGIAYGIPAPGTTMGVSDEVEFTIECELTGPRWAGAKSAAR